MCPLALSLRPALKRAPPCMAITPLLGRPRPPCAWQHILESISHLCTEPQGQAQFHSDKAAKVKARESMSQRDSSKEKGGKKAHATVTERTRLRLSQETQTSIDRHHKGQQEAEPMRGVSAEPWAGRMCRFDSWNGLLSCHLPMPSCWSEAPLVLH